MINVKACNKNISDNKIVGKIGQGKYWQGSDKTHRPDNPPNEGPQHTAPCRGGASCLYCNVDIDAGVMSCDQVNTVQNIVCPFPDGAPAQD